MPISDFFKNGFRPGKPPAAVSIRRDCYTMSMTDGLDAEIQFYGEIVKTRPIDWWTGEPEPGNFIMLDEFLEDLKAIAGAKTLLMRIDSIGGDSEVSMVIHNRLRELPAKKISRIDGVAMSGGTHIALAADIIQVNPASQFLIHLCWGFIFGAYNANELRSLAETWLDPTDKSQIAVYKERTGKTDEELLAMMSKTTTMVGQEIIDAGFADEMLDAAVEKPDIAASADGRQLFVNGRALRISPFVKLPEGIPTVTAAKADAINKNMPAEAGSNEGGSPMPAPKTLEELKKEFPDLCAQLETEAKAAAPAAPDDKESADTAVKEAVAAEQKRLQDIDSIAASVNDDELVREAKYGDKACAAETLAFRAMQKQAKQGAQHLENTQADYTDSGAADVTAAPSSGQEKGGTRAEAETQAKADVEARKKVKEGK